MALVSENEEDSPAASLPPMTAFDIVVVGAGGGPDESNLSAYLFKSHSKRWEDGVLALEAGSGQGTLRQLLRADPDLFKEDSDDAEAPPLTATQIYNSIRCFLITHAHMDHVMSLVVSAGSLAGPRKRICAVKQTLDDIESSIFNDRTWPNLASYKEDDISAKFLYSPLAGSGPFEPVTPDISVRTLPLNHGHNDSGSYESVAFFIRDEPTGKQFLFFGDVEPDSINLHPKTIDVWREAAPLIPDTLSAIFIECSYPSGRPVDQLYGHLTPEYLVQELVVLAKEVRKAKPVGHASDHHMRHTRKRQKRQFETAKALDGLTVYVTHCKDSGEGERPVSEVIVEQVRALAEKEGLGVTIRAAEQGMRIRV